MDHAGEEESERMAQQLFGPIFSKAEGAPRARGCTLGAARDLGQSVSSFARIRGLVGDGILIPGHESALFDAPGELHFRKMNDRVIAIVE